MGTTRRKDSEIRCRIHRSEKERRERGGTQTDYYTYFGRINAGGRSKQASQYGNMSEEAVIACDGQGSCHGFRNGSGISGMSMATPLNSSTM